MNATADAPDLRLLAPEFAGRFAVIIANLVALIARAFLRDPKLAPLIIPLYRRLNGTIRRLSTLMTSFARHGAQRSGIDSGRGASPTAKRPRGQAPRERPRPPIPTTEAWLIHTLRHEGAAYASQLSHLLNEPGVPELLAAAPTAARLLRPLCRMLGLPATALGAAASDRCASSRTESGTANAALRAVGSGGCASSGTESGTANATLPDTPPRGVASQAHTEKASRPPASFPPPPRPPSAVTNPAPVAQPPPCPRLLHRWPWRALTRAKPA